MSSTERPRKRSVFRAMLQTMAYSLLGVAMYVSVEAANRSIQTVQPTEVAASGALELEPPQTSPSAANDNEAGEVIIIEASPRMAQQMASGAPGSPAAGARVATNVPAPAARSPFGSSQNWSPGSPQGPRRPGSPLGIRTAQLPVGGANDSVSPANSFRRRRPRLLQQPPRTRPMGRQDDREQPMRRRGPMNTAPMNPPMNNNPMSSPSDNDPLNDLGLQGEGAAPASGQEDGRIGRAPEETDDNQQFLRQDSILLDPGEYQVEVTVQYLLDSSDFVLVQQNGNNLTIAEAVRRTRLLTTPVEFRLGLTPTVQGFVNVPFGWSNSEIDFAGTDQTSNIGGLGDVSAGVVKQLIEGDKNFPTVLSTFAFSAPTGNSGFLSSLTTPGSQLGQGFWTITGALTFIKRYDPVAVFAGVGYRHRFERNFNKQFLVQPGHVAFYRFGAGFSVNPQVTFSTTVSGSYIGEDTVNGVGIPGSIREPISIRLAATINRDALKNKKDCYRRRRARTIEPFVNFGLTEEAIDSIIGVSWTF